MKTRSLFLGMVCMLLIPSAKGQWVVSDPSNLAQSIVNTAQQIIQTSTIAGNTLSSFQEAVKIYEQGKEYYDALKRVNNLVKDAKKVQQTILMVGEISEIYVVEFNKMLSDTNFTGEELAAIAEGYTILLNESSEVVDELQRIITPSTLSMTDKERMDIVNACYEKVRDYRNLVRYYTNKNIGVSYLRAKKKRRNGPDYEFIRQS